jgi:hypothetical protein
MSYEYRLSQIESKLIVNNSDFAEFILSVVSLRLHEQLLEKNYRKWEKKLAMCYLYLCTGATQEELAKIKDHEGRTTSRQNIDQLIQRTLLKLWKLYLDVHPEKAPTEIPAYKKPTALARKVIFFIREHPELVGTDLLDALERELSISSVYINNIRIQLQEFGISLPYRNSTKEVNREYGADQIIELLQTCQDTELLSEVLNKMSYVNINRIMSNHPNEVILTLQQLVQRAGIPSLNSQRTKGLAQFLNEHDVVVRNVGIGYQLKGKARRLHYYFVPVAMVPRAVELINEYQRETDLRTYGVQQVAGPAGVEIPSFTTFMKLESVSSILKSMGIVRYTGTTIASILGDDCPVPIFRHQGNNRFYAEHEDELRKYLQQRYFSE